MRSRSPRRLILGFAAIVAFASCARLAPSASYPQAEPSGQSSTEVQPKAPIDDESAALSAWRNTPTREALVDFVASVTDPGSSEFREPAERIAVFDLDGTLIVERPSYAMNAFAAWLYRDRLAEDASWADEPPFTALPDLAEIDVEEEPPELPMELVFAARSIVDEGAYHRRVESFLSDVEHPRFDVPWGQTVYAPMRQLVDWLHEHEFRVFVCTGSDIEFARVVATQRLGIPTERVIGTTLESEVVQTSDESRNESRIVVDPEIEVFNNEEAKVLAIERHIGRKPLLVVGNSDGDLAMMRHATAGPRPGFAALVHHDDERGYAYDEGAGEVLETARARGWLVISMRKDFARVLSGAP